ncbi:MAG: hypothetical protein JWM95_1574 [Gemmatimonadetes bacterium]|nr:hypothetical protein [Gemmatimonadota bacterium]
MRTTISLVIFALVSSVSAARAQTLTFDIGKKGGKDALVKSSPDDLTGQQAAPGPNALEASVHCTGTDCTKVTVKLGFSDGSTAAYATPPVASKDTAHFAFTSSSFAGKPGRQLHVLSAGTELALVDFKDDAAKVTPPPAAGGVDSKIATLAAYDCTTELRAALGGIGRTYSRAANAAHFLLQANGNVWSRPPVDSVDENDEILVDLYAHPDLIPAIKLRRSSAFRVPGILGIVGGDAALPDMSKKSAPPAGAPRVACGRLSLSLSDFQPGRGEISIAATSDKGDVPLGTVEFGVNTLYQGAFAFGAIRTNLRDPKFGLVGKGTDSVIVQTEDGSPRTLYVLTYTPFLWGKRDIEKRDPAFAWSRLNPMFGIVLSDVKNNFVVGVNYDLMSAVYLSAGLHLGRVKSLNPDGGVGLGGVFKGTSAQIPTLTEWKEDVYFGISLDLRAASMFFKKALSAPAGS